MDKGEFIKEFIKKEFIKALQDAKQSMVKSFSFLSKTDWSKMEIKLPCLEEQTKIANFLSAIDQKINVVSEQLEQAKLWKKGLLQQMFV